MAENQGLKSPSEMVLAVLRDRVAGDAALEDAVKKAALEDLTGATPSDFTALKALLAKSG